MPGSSGKPVAVSLDKLLNQPLPVDALRIPLFEDFDVELCVVRADQSAWHDDAGNTVAEINGNKLFKLVPNLLAMRERGQDTMISFGGPWSNHLHATANAARALGLGSVGIVRGERPAELTATLADCRRAGMDLYFMPRALYRELPRYNAPAAVQPDLAASSITLAEILGSRRIASARVLPEGGSNIEGVLGAQQLGQSIGKALESRGQSFDTLYLPVGTGGTALGVCSGLARYWSSRVKLAASACPQVTAVAVLRHQALAGDIEQLRARVERAGQSVITADLLARQLRICDGSAGGYAALTPAYQRFYVELERQLPFAVDPVYMGKVFFALWHELHSAAATGGRKIAILHTGGQQGRRGSLVRATESEAQVCGMSL